MKTIAIYLRLSGEDSNNGESDSISNQRELILQYIALQADFKDYTIVEFVDDGYSGASFDRPALNKMMKLIGKTIDVLIVKDFSRFGRNLIEVGNYIDQVFPFLGVRFIAINENYDSNHYKGSTASIDVGLKTLIYELYSRDTSKKIRDVQVSKLKKGEYLGNLPPYGYMRSQVARNKLVANPYTAPVVRYIYQLAASGKKPSEITVILNKEEIRSPRMYHKSKGSDKLRGWRTVGEDGIWIVSTVRTILYDERYTGKQISGKATKADVSTRKMKKLSPDQWIVCENAHEMIVTQEEWDAAQKVIKRRGATGYCTSDYNVFRGIIKCAECGRTLSLFKDQSQPCYRCNTRKFVETCSCSHIRVNESELKAFVLSEIHRQIALFVSDKTKTKAGMTDKLSADVAKLELGVKGLECKKTDLFEKLAYGKISKEIFVSKTSKLSEEKADLENQKLKLLEQLNQIYAAKENPDADIYKYVGITELTQSLVAELVQQIKIFVDGSVEIVWNFTDNINF